MRKTYKGIIGIDFKLPDNGIFVFGSNSQGRHGKGSALTAKLKYGAIYGRATGFQGRSYAICTKNLTKTTHPSVSKEYITDQIIILYNFVSCTGKEYEYYIAYKGSGINLNAYSPEEMAEMFAINYSMYYEEIPKNIIFEEEFGELVKKYCKI